MTAKNTFLILLLIIISLLSFSCKAKPVETPLVETKITGRISDKSSNNPIVGSIVTTQPASSSVTTDVNGNYTISNATTGQYIVSASKDGYKQSSTNVSIKEGQTSSADIQLEKLSAALSVSPAQLNFGTNQTTLSFNITNSAEFGTLEWSILNNTGWISLSQTSGTVSTGTQTITVTINRTGLDFGNYNSVVTVHSNGGNKDISVSATVQNPNVPQLTANPLLLDFGETTHSLKFAITNTGTGKLIWNAATLQQWISLSEQNDSTKLETDSVSVLVNRTGLNPPGNYAGEITISSNAGSQTVNVHMRVPPPPTLSLSTGQLDFGGTLSNLTFTVSNTGSGTLNWSIASNQSWLTVNPFSGAGQSTINVYVNRSGISSGNYSGVLTVSSNGGNANMNVNMSVASATNPAAVTLNAPTNITTSSVDLSWTQNNDADFKQYEIHKSTSTGFTPSSSTIVQTITNKSTTSVTVSGLTAGTTYYFKIRVINTSNLFSDSNERDVKTASGNDTTNGLVAYYPFNGNADDESGNGNNGIVVGATLVSDRFDNINKAYNFNGSSNYIKVTDNSLLDGMTNGATFSFWVKTTEGLAYFLNKMNGSNGIASDDSYQFFVSSNGWPHSYIHYNPGISAEIIYSTQPINNNQWHHFVVVWDKTYQKNYIDGQLVASSGIISYPSIKTTSEHLYFGVSVGEGTLNSFYKGLLDDIRIYNRTLNETEINLLYNEGK